jgi:hypothetical protein
MCAVSFWMNFVIISPGILKQLVRQKLGGGILPLKKKFHPQCEKKDSVYGLSKKKAGTFQ